MQINNFEVRKKLRNWDRLPLYEMNLYYIANSDYLTDEEKQYYIKSLELSKKDRSIKYEDRLLDPKVNHQNKLKLFGSNYDDYKFFVYRMLDAENNIIYIGKSTNLYNRLFGHFRSGHLPVDAYESVSRIEYIILDSKQQMNQHEDYYIAKWKPKYNKQGKHNHPNSLKDEQTWHHYDLLDLLKGYIPELEDLKEKHIKHKKIMLDLIDLQEDRLLYADEIGQILHSINNESFLFSAKQ